MLKLKDVAFKESSLNSKKDTRSITPSFGWTIDIWSYYLLPYWGATAINRVLYNHEVHDTTTSVFIRLGCPIRKNIASSKPLYDSEGLQSERNMESSYLRIENTGNFL